MNDSPTPPASPDKYGSRRSRRPCRPSSSAGPPQRSPRHARPDRHQDHRRRTQHPGSGRRDEAPAPPQPRAHQLPPTTLLARLPPAPPHTPSPGADNTQPRLEGAQPRKTSAVSHLRYCRPGSRHCARRRTMENSRGRWCRVSATDFVNPLVTQSHGRGQIPLHRRVREQALTRVSAGRAL